VGAGKLMVCSLDFDEARPGSRCLRRSILNYMASEEFRPAAALSITDLQKAWRIQQLSEELHQPPASTSPDLVDPGQVRPTSAK